MDRMFYQKGLVTTRWEKGVDKPPDVHHQRVCRLSALGTLALSLSPNLCLREGRRPWRIHPWVKDMCPGGHPHMWRITGSSLQSFGDLKTQASCSSSKFKKGRKTQATNRLCSQIFWVLLIFSIKIVYINSFS